jgi:hypothetical protein
MVAHFEGEHGAVVKLLPCNHEVMVQVLKTASCKNAWKGCVHKT